jgi:hypothetical protein
VFERLRVDVNFTFSVHFPAFGFVFAVASVFVVRPFDTRAVSFAVARLAIVPVSVNVDPLCRAFVIRKLADGAGPDSSTGGFVSTVRRAVIVLGSTVIVAALAESAFPASSCSQTLTTCSPAGIDTAPSRTMFGPAISPPAIQPTPSASHTSYRAPVIGAALP